MNSFDLHMHSCYSNDGEFSPEVLIHMAKEAKLTTIALSDHNTPKGIDEMCSFGKAAGIRVIPAMEFDTLFEELEVHVLGYGIDYTQPYFQELYAVLDERKKAVHLKRVEKIKEVFNLDIDAQALLKQYAGKNPFPDIVHHIMEQYKDKEEFKEYQPGGRRADPQPVNLYWDMCSAQKPCYVRVEYPSLKDTVQRIHEAGGIAVLAHPWLNFYQEEGRLERALKEGIDGIEAYSNYHEPKHNRYYDSYCRKHDVLMTCGSDFHGKMKPKIRMGEYGYEKEDGEELLQAFLKRLNLHD